MQQELTAEHWREMTPEERMAWLQEHLEDWPRFEADIKASYTEWRAYRAAGGEGLPPGWITAREYFRQRGV